VDGLNASLGSKFAFGALSVGVTLATMGAGAGIVTAYMPREGQQYSVRLLDLDKQAFEWNKYDLLKGNIYSIKNHTVQADTILNPLFEVKVN
jgi:16S rRNA G1207 methylase RsmC